MSSVESLPALGFRPRGCSSSIGNAVRSLADLDENSVAAVACFLDRGLALLGRGFREVARRDATTLSFGPSWESLCAVAADMGLDPASKSFFLKTSHKQIWQAVGIRLAAAVASRLSAVECTPATFAFRNTLPEASTPFSGFPVLEPLEIEVLLSTEPLVRGVAQLRLEACLATALTAALPSLQAWTQLRSIELVGCCIDDSCWDAAKLRFSSLSRFVFEGGNSTQMPLPSDGMLPFGEPLRELCLSPVHGVIPQETWRSLGDSARCLRVLHISAFDSRSIARHLVSLRIFPALSLLSLSPQREQQNMSAIHLDGLLRDEDVQGLMRAFAQTLQVLLFAGQQKLGASALINLHECGRLEVLSLRGCTQLSSADALAMFKRKAPASLAIAEPPCRSWGCLSIWQPNLRLLFADDADGSCGGLRPRVGAPLWKDCLGITDFKALEFAPRRRLAQCRSSVQRGWSGPGWTAKAVLGLSAQNG